LAATPAGRSLAIRSHQVALAGSAHLSAPAGFGKSTVLGQWIATLRERGTGFAWLALDQGHDEIGRTYLVAPYAGPIQISPAASASSSISSSCSASPPFSPALPVPSMR
jgi:hypothetical protein